MISAHSLGSNGVRPSPIRLIGRIVVALLCFASWAEAEDFRSPLLAAVEKLQSEQKCEDDDLRADFSARLETVQGKPLLRVGLYCLRGDVDIQENSWLEPDYSLPAALTAFRPGETKGGRLLISPSVEKRAWPEEKSIPLFSGASAGRIIRIRQGDFKGLNNNEIRLPVGEHQLQLSWSYRVLDDPERLKFENLDKKISRDELLCRSAPCRVVVAEKEPGEELPANPRCPFQSEVRVMTGFALPMASSSLPKKRGDSVAFELIFQNVSDVPCRICPFAYRLMLDLVRKTGSKEVLSRWDLFWYIPKPFTYVHTGPHRHDSTEMVVPPNGYFSMGSLIEDWQVSGDFVLYAKSWDRLFPNEPAPELPVSNRLEFTVEP